MARRKATKKKNPNIPPTVREEGNKEKETNGEEEAAVESLPEIPIPDFVEPEIPWADSNARALLVKDLLAGVVPLEVDSAMPTQTIFTSRPEYAPYGYKNFSSRLSGLRKIVARDKTRADKDAEAFANFKANNIIHTHNPRGYPEWDGSKAHKQLEDDIDNDLHELMDPYELWCLREVYDPFPLKVFRDHIYQIIKTRKYLHTLEVKGKSGMKGRDKKKK